MTLALISACAQPLLASFALGRLLSLSQMSPRRELIKHFSALTLQTSVTRDQVPTKI